MHCFFNMALSIAISSKTVILLTYMRTGVFVVFLLHYGQTAGQIGLKGLVGSLLICKICVGNSNFHSLNLKQIAMKFSTPDIFFQEIKSKH